MRVEGSRPRAGEFVILLHAWAEPRLCRAIGVFTSGGVPCVSPRLCLPYKGSAGANREESPAWLVNALARARLIRVLRL